MCNKYFSIKQNMENMENIQKSIANNYNYN